MTFTPIEREYLTAQQFGRLATAQPDGTLQVNPVSFHFDPDQETIDVHGFNLETSRKYRNVLENGRVAFVVDDVPSFDPIRVRCVEIRGHADAIPAGHAEDGTQTPALICIHPQRIISFGISEDVAPHLMTPHIRDVDDDSPLAP